MEQTFFFKETNNVHFFRRIRFKKSFYFEELRHFLEKSFLKANVNYVQVDFLTLGEKSRQTVG